METKRGDFHKVFERIRSDDIYDVYDLKFINNATLSITEQHPGKKTRGHSHEKSKEVYLFLEGSGEIQVGDERFPVKKDDIVLVPAGKFHRVFNTGKTILRFLNVFENYERGKDEKYREEKD